MIGEGRFCEKYCHHCCCLFQKELLNECVLFLSETLVDVCLFVATGNGDDPWSIRELAAKICPLLFDQRRWHQVRKWRDPSCCFSPLF